MKRTSTMKPILFLLGIMVTIILLIPTILVIPFTKEPAPETVKTTEPLDQNNTETVEYVPSQISVAVYRSQKEKTEQVRLDDYIVGVVASEMPAEYELEALKAQALSARTYIVKHLLNGDKMSSPDGADVTDTIMHQVYKSKEELKALWGADYQWKIAKIEKAVHETSNQIITYNDDPITASFFSTSNGYTENAEDYWQNPFPYLKSVESPWDEKSPKFHDQKIFTIKDFENKLGISLANSNEVSQILARTEGNRVEKVKIGSKTFSGRDIREILGLNSSDFTLERKNNHIVINTKGWGHGVGMSQFGAHGMALEGKNYKEIISHYYKQTEISEIDGFEQKLMVKQ